MRKRPGRHFRKVRTRRGRQERLVNPFVPLKKKVRINKVSRSAFTALSKTKNVGDVEHAGFIDFGNKGVLQRFSAYKGRSGEVEYPGRDFEMDWHTHPGENTFFAPSGADIEELMMHKNLQAKVIFREGRSMTVLKTPKAEEWARRTNITEELDRRAS